MQQSQRRSQVTWHRRGDSCLWHPLSMPHCPYFACWLSYRKTAPPAWTDEAKPNWPHLSCLETSFTYSPRSLGSTSSNLSRPGCALPNKSVGSVKTAWTSGLRCSRASHRPACSKQSTRSATRADLPRFFHCLKKAVLQHTGGWKSQGGLLWL